MRSRLIWVDVVRALSVLAVIVIHVTSPLLTDWALLGGQGRLASALLNVTARFCVPVFFMASGYLLLARDEPVREFFRRRAVRVLIPLVAWSLIYAFWFGWLQGWVLIPSYWLKALVKIVVGVPTYFHLGFLYALVGIYLFVPILRHLVRTIDARWLWYFALLWFIATPILLTVQSFTGRSTSYDLGDAGGYFGYFLLGHLLGRLDLTPARARWAGLGWLALAALTTALGLWVSTEQGGFQAPLVSYLSPQVTGMSVCAFLALRALGERIPEGKGQVWSLLGQASFGVYLVHMLVLDVLREAPLLGWSVLSGNPWWAIVSQALAVALLSLAVVLLLRRIPGVKSIIP